MKMRWLAAAVLVVACAWGGREARAEYVDQGATSGTVTLESVVIYAGVRVYTFDCLSDASGNVTLTDHAGIVGTVRHVELLADSGATQPSDDWDVTLTDEMGVDVLMGLGADLSHVTPTKFVPLTGDGTTTTTPVATYGPLDLAATGVGNAKGFLMRLLVAPGF